MEKMLNKMLKKNLRTVNTHSPFKLRKAITEKNALHVRLCKENQTTNMINLRIKCRSSQDIKRGFVANLRVN